MYPVSQVRDDCRHLAQLGRELLFRYMRQRVEQLHGLLEGRIGSGRHAPILGCRTTPPETEAGQKLATPWCSAVWPREAANIR